MGGMMDGWKVEGSAAEERVQDREVSLGMIWKRVVDEGLWWVDGWKVEGSAAEERVLESEVVAG